MDNLAVWRMYFAGVCALRCHPKNFDHRVSKDLLIFEVDLASRIADIMMQEDARRVSKWRG